MTLVVEPGTAFTCICGSGIDVNIFIYCKLTILSNLAIDRLVASPYSTWLALMGNGCALSTVLSGYFVRSGPVHTFR
ncbi:hypothetical protein BKA82DRAFT_4237340 [Pisolithus tinctorius]|nr:hypothetical protein BKA82DRAFT_4237340 [Pisolithus tinctorius]